MEAIYLARGADCKVVLKQGVTAKRLTSTAQRYALVDHVKGVDVGKINSKQARQQKSSRVNANAGEDSATVEISAHAAHHVDAAPNLINDTD